MGGRVEVQSDDVAHLVDKHRIARQLEGFKAVRLQPEGAPDASDARGRDAAVPRHAARTPMRGIRWLTLQRLHDDALDFCCRRSCAGRQVAARRATRRGRARQNAGAICPRFAVSPARAPPPPCCSDPPRSPARSAPAAPKPAPSCAVAYSLPEPRQSRPTAQSSPPGGPSASPCPRRYGSPKFYYTNFWFRTLAMRKLGFVPLRPKRLVDGVLAAGAAALIGAAGAGEGPLVPYTIVGDGVPTSLTGTDGDPAR